MIRSIVEHDDRTVSPVRVLTVKNLRQSEDKCDKDLRVDSRLGDCEVDLALRVHGRNQRQSVSKLLHDVRILLALHRPGLPNEEALAQSRFINVDDSLTAVHKPNQFGGEALPLNSGVQQIGSLVDDSRLFVPQAELRLHDVAHFLLGEPTDPGTLSGLEHVHSGRDTTEVSHHSDH